MRVLVTATNPDGHGAGHEHAGRAGRVRPAGEHGPADVTGTPQRTVTLTATPGTWTGPGITYAYQWQRADGGDVDRTSPARPARRTRSAAADEGDDVRVLVTATQQRRHDQRGERPTGAVSGRCPPATRPCRRSPARRSAPYTLTATHRHAGAAAATPTPTSGSARPTATGWIDISGATGADVHARRRRRGLGRSASLVTATNPDGERRARRARRPRPSRARRRSTGRADDQRHARSAPPRSPRRRAPGAGSATATPTSGSARPTAGDWTNIAGATAPTYTIGVGDEGAALSPASSPPPTPTATVERRQRGDRASSRRPAGEHRARRRSPARAQRGDTLTATAGTWSGLGNTYAYQWQRSPDGGSTWTEHRRRDGSTYTLAAADEGDACACSSPPPTPTARVARGERRRPAPCSPPPRRTPPPRRSPAPRRAAHAHRRRGDVGRARQRLRLPVAALGRRHHVDEHPRRDRARTTLAVADEGDVRAPARHRHQPRRQRVSVASAPTATVHAPRRRSNTAAPTITGTAQRASALTATQGTWTGAGNAYAYQWQRSTDGGDAGRASPAPPRRATRSPSPTRAPPARARHRHEPRRRARARRAAPTSTVPSVPAGHTAAPAVSGTPQRSFTLTGDAGHVERHRQRLHLPVAAQRRRRLHEHHRRHRLELHARGRPTRAPTLRLLVTATNADGTVTAASAATARRARRPAGEHRGADDLRHGRAHRHPDRRAGDVERDRQQLRLSVAALARRRRRGRTSAARPRSPTSLATADEGDELRLRRDGHQPRRDRQRRQRGDGDGAAPPRR